MKFMMKHTLLLLTYYFLISGSLEGMPARLG